MHVLKIMWRQASRKEKAGYLFIGGAGFTGILNAALVPFGGNDPPLSSCFIVLFAVVMSMYSYHLTHGGWVENPSNLIDTGIMILMTLSVGMFGKHGFTVTRLEKQAFMVCLTAAIIWLIIERIAPEAQFHRWIANLIGQTILSVGYVPMYQRLALQKGMSESLITGILYWGFGWLAIYSTRGVLGKIYVIRGQLLMSVTLVLIVYYRHHG